MPGIYTAAAVLAGTVYGQNEAAPIEPPFAPDLAPDRADPGLGPGQVPDRLGPEDDPVESDGGRVRLDAGHPGEEPFADRAEHRMVVRIGVVAEFPVFPERRRAAVEHVAPAGEGRPVDEGTRPGRPGPGGTGRRGGTSCRRSRSPASGHPALETLATSASNGGRRLRVRDEAQAEGDGQPGLGQGLVSAGARAEDLRPVGGGDEGRRDPGSGLRPPCVPGGRPDGRPSGPSRVERRHERRNGRRLRGSRGRPSPRG